LGLRAQQADSSIANSPSATNSANGPDITNPPASSQPAAGTIPRLIKFAGSVQDLTGKVPAGVVGLTFSLYELPEGGNPLWTETQSLTLDAQGHYAALLGANSPEGLPLDLFTSSKALWLGVQPQLPGEVEQPRVLLVAVPYALKSSDADTLGGLPASAYMLSPSANVWESITLPRPISSPGSGGGATSGPITGVGTANYAAMFTGASTIGNSAIYNSLGGLVGIGTTSPAVMLDVAGTTGVQGELVADELSANNGAVNDGTASGRGLVFGGTGSGEGIASKRTPGGNQWGLDFYSSFGNRMSITNSGNVGIGTTTPGALLEVNGTAKFDQAVTFAQPITTSGVLTSTVSTGTAPLSVASTTQVPNLDASLLGGVPASGYAPASGSAVYVAKVGDTMTGVLYLPANGLVAGTNQLVLSSGNVAIGTATPVALLDIEGTGPAPVSSGNGTNAETALQIVGAAGGKTNSGSGSDAGGTGAAVTITAGAGGGSGFNASGGAGGALSITAGAGSGASPVTSGAIGGAGGAVTIAAGAGGCCSDAGPGGTVTISAGAGGSSNQHNGGNGGNIILNPGAAGPGINYYGAPGRVGIGTTTPAVTLDVAGSTGVEGELLADSLNGNNGVVNDGTASGRGLVFGGSQSGEGIASKRTTGGNQYGLDFYTYFSNRMSITGYGYVGIETTAPDNTLTVNGSADKPGGGSWGTFSDARLKTVNGSFRAGLEAILKLRPVRYRYKAQNALGIKDNEEHVGFVAQEVQKLIPEAVSPDNQGYLIVNNDPILWAMLNAIKEQQAQIREQHTEIGKLARASVKKDETIRLLTRQVQELQTVQQQMAALEARLARVEVRSARPQAASAAGGVERRNPGGAARLEAKVHF
jgi:hypothetical protein